MVSTSPRRASSRVPTRSKFDKHLSLFFIKALEPRIQQKHHLLLFSQSLFALVKNILNVQGSNECELISREGRHVAQLVMVVINARLGTCWSRQQSYQECTTRTSTAMMVHSSDLGLSSLHNQCQPPGYDRNACRTQIINQIKKRKRKQICLHKPPQYASLEALFSFCPHTTPA